MVAEDTLDRVLALILQQPLELRGRFLDIHCAHDPELRAALDPLVREAAENESFLRPGGALDGPLGQGILAGPLALEPGVELATSFTEAVTHPLHARTTGRPAQDRQIPGGSRAQMLAACCGAVLLVTGFQQGYQRGYQEGRYRW